jgi:hypothetical protein
MGLITLRALKKEAIELAMQMEVNTARLLALGVSLDEARTIVQKYRGGVSVLVEYKARYGRFPWEEKEPTMDQSEVKLTTEVTTVAGQDGEVIPAAHLTLGIEKVRVFRRKYYRLIWIDGNTAWSCLEEKTGYQRKRDVVEAGRALAKKVKARQFSEVTR